MDITLKTYQNPSKLKSKLKGYINSLASFEKTKYGGTLYKVSEGTSRTLELAIPPVEMTKAQSDVFKEVFDYFRSKGELPFEASDGMQALSLIEENEYDAVLLDIMMPKLDGLSV